jgi:hydrogenase nickel incorporation protein HypB
MLLNKIDLLPHVRFDVDRAIAHAREVNPKIEVLQLSAQTGEELDRWFDWIAAAHKDAAAGAFA